MFTRSADLIGRRLNPPSTIRLDHRCLTLLHRSLLAVWPEEGCALLLGRFEATASLRLETVWPACNRWGAAEADMPWIVARPAERDRNFLLDPREQLAAQRWARSRGQMRIGVAHSHPASNAEPSVADRQRAEPHQLMLILGNDGQIQAWWLGEDRQVRPVLIDVQ